mmetsp:Transcript_8445/g.12480  ORF Transcript_8445/g.12480 Transcript_8445/m.12480 type:complete len:205 (-) Transcript_8445:1199-1813(-)
MKFLLRPSFTHLNRDCLLKGYRVSILSQEKRIPFIGRKAKQQQEYEDSLTDDEFRAYEEAKIKELEKRGFPTFSIRRSHENRRKSRRFSTRSTTTALSQNEQTKARESSVLKRFMLYYTFTSTLKHYIFKPISTLNQNFTYFTEAHLRHSKVLFSAVPVRSLLYALLVAIFVRLMVDLREFYAGRYHKVFFSFLIDNKHNKKSL